MLIQNTPMLCKVILKVSKTVILCISMLYTGLITCILNLGLYITVFKIALFTQNNFFPHHNIYINSSIAICNKNINKNTIYRLVNHPCSYTSLAFFIKHHFIAWFGCFLHVQLSILC